MIALALLLSPQFVVAINNPIMWNSSNDGGPPAAVGLSGYIGLDRHQVLRLNYATYAVDNDSQLVDAILAPEAGDGDCAYELSGRSDDFGVGWDYFVRERYRGLSIELGVVRKSMHLSHCMEDSGGEYASTRYTTSTAYVARAMLAWSWLYTDHLFASFGAGLSAGREAGSDDATGAHFHQLVAYPEVYFRAGFAFL
jgi:hypothetical protein